MEEGGGGGGGATLNANVLAVLQLEVRSTVLTLRHQPGISRLQLGSFCPMFLPVLIVQ